MGVAGMVMSSGYDALWYPVCYACGYLFLLLFIAGPLRRFGAYTIPDFAEGRFDSPLFRKIAVVFVLFIGFFYTMPQMKGAGTTLAYIFPGMPYWAGVVLVGAVITLNVALGGMKGITLVQAFQYWAKMFAISVPIFVLMAVYGNYGKQLQINTSERINDFPVTAKLSSEPRQFRKQMTVLAAADEYARLTGRKLLYSGSQDIDRLDEILKGRLSMWGLIRGPRLPIKLINFETAVPSTDPLTNLSGSLSDTVRLSLGPSARSSGSKMTVTGRGRLPSGTNAASVETSFVHVSPQQRVLDIWKNLKLAGVDLIPVDKDYLLAAARQRWVTRVLPEKAPSDSTWLNPFGPLTTKAAKAAKLSPEESKPYSLLYTYSLIIALVCGTAGLPHILVRFYTNPDGVAAKRTTMWVMILIGVFYLFPPVFGVMGRNLLPGLYAGTGAKGTDKVVLELPRILNQNAAEMSGEAAEGSEGRPSSSPSSPTSRDTPSSSRETGIPWGSILSGITCAGAFAAFMSTFSGLLVSMTGAMAHDVYGRMLNPKATPQQRLRAFKIATIVIGALAIVLGMQVEPLQINFMVGQAFAIAAASYFPLLFMSTWWRGMTMKGAAIGMLTGGICALVAVTLTNFSDLGWLKLTDFWATHPLLRILCEQPAIWTVPLALGSMCVFSKLTAKDIPPDIRMKMLVLHAPEKLGLKQEYIQEHQHGH
jgi:Na+(H+)/acetate symporter ActP